MSLKDEIKKRRTFAIIAHPDAGKTTLTEKNSSSLVVQSIRRAPSNPTKSTRLPSLTGWKSRSSGESPWRLRSWASNTKDIKINLLDTPGHQDFAEDTYRTLTAVDSVIMVIDCVKGVEIQTEKTHGGLPHAEYAGDLLYQ